MDTAPAPSPPPPVPLDRCGACGQATDAPERCPHCGSTLLVDVTVEPAPAGPRAVYGAARAAASASLPGLDFAAARGALERPGAPLAQGLRRDRARALVAALAEGGFSAAARVSLGAGAARGVPRAFLLLVALGVAAVLVALAAAFLLARPSAEKVVAGAPAARAAAGATATAAAAPAEAEGAAAKAEAAGEAPGRLGTEELARAGRGAVVLLSCGTQLGTGFFVSADRVLTNAHVTCGPSTRLDVKLPSGRRVTGAVRAHDAWLDYAVVEVSDPGATEPLPLGDSTTLVEGNPVVIVGNPIGLDRTVHTGTVSSASRNLHGVAHVQLNADVNPGNSGGPVLDARGRAVAIVTLKAAGASGVGFALPIEYTRGDLVAAPRDPAGAARWTETLSRVRQEDDEEARTLVARLERPMLVAAGAVQGRLALVVIQRWATSPATVPLEAVIREGNQVVCEVSGAAAEWLPLEEKFREASEQDRATRLVRWMARRRITDGVWAGVGAIDVSSCPRPPRAEAVVSLRGAREESAPYPARELADSGRLATARTQAIARSEAAASARAEAEWRRAFQQARAKVASLEAKRRLHRDALNRQNDVNLLDRARRELPTVERDLAAAQEALDDLERKASHEAIPREWRQ